VSRGKRYKVKLASGRILGPLDIERVCLLIAKNQIVGKEIAREYPSGEWKDINLIPEIATALVRRVRGSVLGENTKSSERGAAGSPRVLPGATNVFAGSSSLAPLPELKTLSKNKNPNVQADPAPGQPGGAPKPPPLPDASDEKTEMIGAADESRAPADPFLDFPAVEDNLLLESRKISTEKTVVFQKSIAKSSLQSIIPKPTGKLREVLKATMIAIVLGMIGYELFLAEPLKQPYKFHPIRPSLPEYVKEQGDPAKSAKLYQEALRPYLADTVLGYRRAAEKLHRAVSYDMKNVKALAMLASAYLNLIDSSNKDENYFSVISKLIEMSRAKAVDLPETVISDVEFYITINKPEAAQNRIVEYTKTHQQFGIEMFYYLALAFYHRGDAASAARYLAQFPDQKAFSAKLFHLRGLVAEKLIDYDAALREYEKAIRFNPNHAKSRLRITDLLNRRGELKSAGAHLQFLTDNPGLLAPKDLGLAYYLHAIFQEQNNKLDIAMGYMERAVRIDPGNHEYFLELYTLRAKAGDSIKSYRGDARMYYFLGEGEKLVKAGKYQEALIQFMQARHVNDKSPLPLVKMGDMFVLLHDLGNARTNFKLAADRAPSSIDVWSKYIKVLIQSYEWEEAKKAMDKFRSLPVPQSAIDKAAADMYAKQNQHRDAQIHYRNAMKRDVIDPDVYIAYADSLLATNRYQDAPFFYALALRFDPLNFNALVGTAKCIAATEGIDRAITMLQDELQKGTAARAELLSAIAELQIQKGAWEQAQQNVEQAMAANPDYAYPWKLQGQIYMNKRGSERLAIDKALEAYQSYSDRNPSDPSGYLERYAIFAEKLQYDKASEELSKIYMVYPKYPNLHFYKGQLYAIMGNHKTAIEEFRTELKNNPASYRTMIHLGKELVEAGDYVNAITFYNKAMQLRPKDPEPKQLAAYANYLIKNYQGAIALYQAALVYDPANPIIHKRLGMAYRDSGDVASAAISFRKYLQMEPDAPDRALFERYQ